MIIDGVTLVLIVVGLGLMLLIPIINFGAIWYSSLIYKVQMKEMNQRHWLSNMGLWETSLMKRKRLSR